MFAQVKIMLALAVIFIVVACSPALATIINVPDDYSTIQAGIDASSDGDTVLVAEGQYYERINFYGKGILLTSEFMLNGDTLHIQNTIIDADTSVLGVADTGSVVCFVNGEDSTSVIQGFTIQNGIGIIGFLNDRFGGGIYCMDYSSPIICNNIINENSANYGCGVYLGELSRTTIRSNIITRNSTDGIWNKGGGIYCENRSSPAINNNTICFNYAGIGGGIYCGSFSRPGIGYNNISENSANACGGIMCMEMSQPSIKSNIVSGNSTAYNGGGMCFAWNSTPNIVNNTIVGNSAGVAGGGIKCSDNSDPIIINTILWDNIADSAGNQMYWGNVWPTSEIIYSNIQGGWEGRGNIDANPLFVDPDNCDYYLQAGSPCIDAGFPYSPLDPDSTRADMGAFYFDQSTSIEEAYILPLQFLLSQNYPNPFNPTTTISFAIEHPQFVTLKVYDLLGREVQMLISEDRQAGLHNVTFDASDLSSGIYFYRLQAGDIAESKRMVLLK